MTFAPALLALVLAAAFAAANAGAETLAVRAERLLPVSAPVIEDGVVVIRDGRIEAVAARAGIALPPGARVLDAAWATPGLIDVHTSVGLSGLLNVADTRDQDETTDPVQASLRAIDAFNPREPLLRYLLEHGVTLVQSGPGPATPIAGQAGIFRTHGSDADSMVVRFPSALVFNLGEHPKSSFGATGRFPATRMGVASLVRRKLSEGRHPRRWGGLFARREPDADLEILGQAARGELATVFTAHRADDIRTALRIADEYGLRAAIAGGTEAYLVLDALRDAGVPVFAGPVMEEPFDLERINASLETPAFLADAGIEFAIRSGFEEYVPKSRVVLFEAAVAAANGLGAERALRAITLDAARLLAVDDRYGSLSPGKVADVVLFDGDPFEYTSHVVAVIAEGEVVYER